MQSIHIHVHWYPGEWLKILGRDGPKEGASLERTAKGYAVRTERIVNASTEPVATVERLGFLSPEEKNLIKGGTAARLLRLQPSFPRT